MKAFVFFGEILKRKTLKMFTNNGDETTSAASRQQLHPFVAPTHGTFETQAYTTSRVLVIFLFSNHLHTN